MVSKVSHDCSQPNLKGEEGSFVLLNQRSPICPSQQHQGRHSDAQHSKQKRRVLEETSGKGYSTLDDLSSTVTAR